MDGKTGEPIVMPRARQAAPRSDGRPPRRAEELAVLFRLTERLYRASGADDTYDAALDAITHALGCERASIMLFDEAGVMRFVAWRGLSEGYRRAVDGHSHWKPDDHEPDPIFVRDIAETEEPEWLKRRIVSEGIRGLAFIPLVVQNECIGEFMICHAEPHPFTDAEGEIAVHIARQLGFSLERARADEGRRRAEQALRETEDRFRTMSEHAPVMIWVSNPDGSCLHLNKMLREFWGVDDEDVADFDWRTSMHPDDVERITNEMVQAATTQTPVTVDGRYRNAAGEYRTLSTHARPRIGEDGAFMGMIGVNIDTTERTRAEAQRELLLAELSHRVKNMLAVVQGIARQTFRNTESVPAARQTFEGRLTALATAHDLLTRSNWETASLAELARGTLPVRADGPQVSISGPDVMLDPKKTLALTMALHELFTNAIKYGALSTETGSVALAWSVETGPDGSAPRLRLEWRETGAPSTAPPVREGFGTRLIQQVFRHDLCGEIMMEFAPSGLVCVADLSLD